MKGRIAGFMLTGILGIVLAGFSVGAQAPKKLPSIGYLSANTAPTAPILEAFRRGLGELGWIEGHNIALEWRSAAGQDELLPELLNELLQRKIDIIVAGGPQATRAAKQMTSTTPIVMVGGDPDPVAAGLIPSLARPGGNLTGLATAPPELLRGKQLELLKEAVPGISRAAVLWDPAASALDLVKAIEDAARVLAVELQLLEVRAPDDFEEAFALARRQRNEALLIVESPLLTLHRARVAALALESRLPAMALFSEFAEAGCLITYGPNLADQARRASVYVDKILKGTKPGDLPVEQPMRFELVINLKTAKTLGLTVPAAVLFQADRVIQ